MAFQPAQPAIKTITTTERWRWDGVDFAMLHPKGGAEEGNDASCVLRISTAVASALLPGDIEQVVERRLAAELGSGLGSDVLIAAHHGSATSSSSAFLAAVDPRWVLYAAGYANRFGFPAEAGR